MQLNIVALDRTTATGIITTAYWTALSSEVMANIVAELQTLRKPRTT